MNKLDRRLIHSPITRFVRDVFEFLKWLSPMRWLALLYSTVYRSRSELAPSEIGSRRQAARRARAIEVYIISWLIIEVVFSIAVALGVSPYSVRALMALMAALRALEIIQVTVNAALFDILHTRTDHRVASMSRMVVLAGINYVELIICFGIIYASHATSIGSNPTPILGFYMSAVTQLGVGYSDVFPLGWLRLVAVLQALVAFFFVIIVLGRFIASLRQITSLFDD